MRRGPGPTCSMLKGARGARRGARAGRRHHRARSVPHLQDARGATIVVQGTPVGVNGELHPAVQKAFDLPVPAFVAELSLDAIEALPSVSSSTSRSSASGRPADLAGGAGSAGGRRGPRHRRASARRCAQARRPLRRLRGRAGGPRSEDPATLLYQADDDAHRHRGQRARRGGRAAPGESGPRRGGRAARSDGACARHDARATTPGRGSPSSSSTSSGRSS